MKRLPRDIGSSSRLLQRQRELPWPALLALLAIVALFLVSSWLSEAGRCRTDAECAIGSKTEICAQRKRVRQSEADGSWPQYGVCTNAPVCDKRRPCMCGRSCITGRCRYKTTDDPGFVPEKGKF